MSDSAKLETKVLDWEEDDFEEFEDLRKGVAPMTDDSKKAAAPKSMNDTDENKKWDDDDIDELFPSLLSKEISFKHTNEVAPVGLTTSRTLKKSRARQESELAEREKLLAQKEFAIAQRKKALDGLTDALRNPDAKAVKKYKMLEDSSKAVDKMFKDIQDEEGAGTGADDEKYAGAAVAEFSAWMDLHKASKSVALYDLREREMKIKEREAAIKLQETQLEVSRTKMRRSRRSSIARMMAPNVSVKEVEEKEETESAKVLAVRQRARRRASIQATYDKAKGSNATMEEAKQLLVEAALKVAKAEETEESEMLGADHDDHDEAMTPASPPKASRARKGSTNLPYTPRQNDKVDAALAAEVNDAGVDVYLKRLAMKGKKKRNKNMYQLGNGKKIIVRVVHKVVVASLKDGPAHWVPVLQLLKDEAA